MKPVVWLVIIIILLAIELILMNLTAVWVAAGAAVALVFSLCGLPGWSQVAACFAVTVLMMFFVRPVAMKYYHRGRRQAIDELIIGADGIVLSEINTRQGVGQIAVGEKVWAARGKDPKEIFKPGTVVIVLDVRAGKAIVREKTISDRRRMG